MDIDPNLEAETVEDREEYTEEVVEGGAQVNADGADETAAEATGDTEEAPAAKQPVEDPRYTALLARLETTERELGQVREQTFHQQVKDPLAEIPDQPPIDPLAIKTNAEWQQYEQWKQAWTFKHATLAARAEARAESAVASARGELNESAMGPGYGYDALVGSYTVPAERKNPALTAFFNQTEDPAIARYTYALMRKIGEKASGNRVKAFQQLRDFVEGKTSPEAHLAAKIKSAEKSGAQRVQQAKGAAPRQRREKTAEEIRGMTESQYRKYREERGNPL